MRAPWLPAISSSVAAGTLAKSPTTTSSARVRAACGGLVGTTAVVFVATSARSAESESAWSGSSASVTCGTCEFEVRVAHGVDERAALALEALRHRGAGQQRERGEQQVGRGKSVSALQHRVRRPEALAQRAGGRFKRGAENERVSVATQVAQVGQRSAGRGERREAVSAAVERTGVGQEHRHQAELLGELRDPHGVAGREVSADEDGDAVGIGRGVRLGVAGEAGQRVDRCGVALFEPSDVVGSVDREHLAERTRRRASGSERVDVVALDLGERLRRRARPARGAGGRSSRRTGGWS